MGECFIWIISPHVIYNPCLHKKKFPCAAVARVRWAITSSKVLYLQRWIFLRLSSEFEEKVIQVGIEPAKKKKVYPSRFTGRTLKGSADAFVLICRGVKLAACFVAVGRAWFDSVVCMCTYMLHMCLCT